MNSDHTLANTRLACPFIPGAPSQCLLAQDISPVELPAFVQGDITGWEEAELSESLVYLRGSLKLSLPLEWELHAPTLDVLKDL